MNNFLEFLRKKPVETQVTPKVETKVETAPAGATTPAAVTTQAPKDEASLFADFLKGKQEVGTTAPPKEPINPWEIKPENLSATFGNINVQQYINQEDLTKATSGDINALLNIINTATKVGAMSAYQASMENTHRGVKHSAEELKASFPEVVKSAVLNATINGDDTLSAPLLKPITDIIAKKLTEEFPEATAADIKVGVDKYIQLLVAGKNTPSTTEPPSHSIDWDKHFSNGVNL